jgi:hypothetical protein
MEMQDEAQGEVETQGYREASEEDNSLMERIVVNAMNIISGKHAGKVDSILNAGKSPGEGLSNAISFVLQAVIGGLQQKGVTVSPELVISENGAASQITQLLMALIGASGKEITPDEVQQALSVGIDNFATKQRMDGEKAQQGGEPPTDGVQPPPPQQGLLAGSARA